MNKNKLTVVALILGVGTALFLHFTAPSDKEIIQSIIYEIESQIEAAPFPTDFAKQTKLSKSLMLHLSQDVELFDDLKNPKSPQVNGKSNLLRILYVALRLLETAELRIEDLSIEVKSKTDASATFAVDYTAKYRINAIADGVAPLTINFKKIEGDWKIVSARRVDVFE